MTAYELLTRRRQNIDISADENSMRSIAGDHDQHGAEQYRCIEQQIAMADVMEIAMQIVVNRRTARGTDLPQAGHAGTHRKPLSFDACVSRCNERHLWSRADKAHFAAQNIYQLWKLIDTRATKKSTEASHPPVVWMAWRTRIAARTRVHRTELPDHESPALEAHAELAEQSRSWAIHPNEERDNQKKGRECD